MLGLSTPSSGSKWPSGVRVFCSVAGFALAARWWFLFGSSVARGPFCSWAGLLGVLLLRCAVGFCRSLAGCSASGLLLFASALVLWLGPVWAGARLARSPLVVWRRRLPFVVVEDCSL